MRTPKIVLTFLLGLCSVGGAVLAAQDNSIPDPFANLKNSGAQATASGAPAPQAGPIIIPEPPVFEDTAWALIDYFSGHVICEHNSQAKIWPASLTKMMTSYVIGMEVKAGRLDLDSDIVIPEDAWSKNYSDSSKMFIEVGKEIKVRDLVKGIIIQSGNDACVAMALHLAGTEQGFVGVMNSYAQKLGLKNTHFSNVHGLFDEQNYSTAYDMALMGRALIRDLPEEYVLYSQKEFTFNGIKQYNRNRLLWDNSVHVDGIKTGHLSQAGYNLVASATEGNMRLIASVIGAKSDKQRALDCKSLLTYGFRYFELYSPFAEDKVLMSREVRMGSENKVDIGLKEPLQMMIPRGSQNRVKVNYRLKSSYFIAPLAVGDELGIIEVKLDDRLIAAAPLVAKSAVGEGGFFSKIWDRFIMFFISSEPEQDDEDKKEETQSSEKKAS